MAKIAFKSCNQHDGVLFPSYIGDLIPEDHPVRVLNEVLDTVDISGVMSTYKGGGASCYHPRMMLKVIVYCYLNNIYSGRMMERKLSEDLPLMWLSGMSRPDFRTINMFRSMRLRDSFDSIFTQTVRFLCDQGLLSLEEQYIDGTKIESVANKYTFVWRGSVEKNKAKLESKVNALLSEIERQLKIEIAQDEKITADSRDYTRRVKRAMDKIQSGGISDKALEKNVRELTDELIPRESRYEESLEILGERNSYSKTDHDATFMRMKEDAMMNGQTKPGYNVQISTNNQYILNYSTFWRPADQATLIPFLTQYDIRYGLCTRKVIADSGYGSEQNYAYLEGRGVSAYVKYNMFHKEDTRKYRCNPFLPMNLYRNEEQDFYICPMGQRLSHLSDAKTVSELGYESTVSKYRCYGCKGCPVRGFCYKGRSDYRTIEVNHKANEYKATAKELLTSEEGLYHRSMRPIEPEAVFGDIKQNHHFRRFYLKGHAKVRVEFGLVALAHNLRKYARSVGCTMPNSGINWVELSKKMAA